MAVEIFLKIDGVTGESKANGHVDEIEVFSFSLGASNPSSVAYGHGSGAGKVDISSLSIQKQVDNASAKLFQNCASGKHSEPARWSFAKRAVISPSSITSLRWLSASSTASAGAVRPAAESLPNPSRCLSQA